MRKNDGFTTRVYQKNNQEIEKKKMVNRMSKLEDHDQPDITLRRL